METPRNNRAYGVNIYKILSLTGILGFDGVYYQPGLPDYGLK